MIWVEILTRHREIAARFRIQGSEAHIGRGYDNDVIIDDPHVAAQHLRVFRDETGQLVAEDLGSLNGMFIDSGRSRQARIVVDGGRPIRIGQTWLRFRETSHAVEPERLVPSERRSARVVLAILLGLLIPAIEALEIWLTQTSEPRASTYLRPLLMILAGLIGWVGFWALLSRIFSGRSRFLDHLLVAMAGVLAFSLYDEVAQFLAFAWTWPAPSTYQYVALWSILALVCFLDLRQVGRPRPWLKGLLVLVLLAAAIAVQTLQLSEAFSDSGRQFTARLLLPPAFRLAPLRDEAGLFDDIEKLKLKLDADRIKAAAGPVDGIRVP
jgi:hypothetical protein